MANLDLSKYGITGVTEILHNPSYDVLFAEETKPSLYGGLLTNTKTTTNLVLKKLGLT